MVNVERFRRGDIVEIPLRVGFMPARVLEVYGPPTWRRVLVEIIFSEEPEEPWTIRYNIEDVRLLKAA
jgi:hypothetical protein